MTIRDNSCFCTLGCRCWHVSCGALVVSTNIHASRLMFAERPVLVPAPSCCSFPSQKLASAPPCSLPSLSCFLLVFHLATSLHAPGLINEDLSSFPIVKTCPGPMVYSVPLSHYTSLERGKESQNHGTAWARRELLRPSDPVHCGKRRTWWHLLACFPVASWKPSVMGTWPCSCGGCSGDGVFHYKKTSCIKRKPPPEQLNTHCSCLLHLAPGEERAFTPFVTAL